MGKVEKAVHVYRHLQAQFIFNRNVNNFIGIPTLYQ